ncbi:glycosyltransferase involved in cell wall biosynthesis [Leeuwenhoekiella aestuarii]|uniref:glycosyltransferase family 4 protein n=1 Tax=Leeuwenhoekiella aestuarii TaxID=2249426 RepID=UPI000FFF35C9|nr:glycosyltransferase family 4 protein [Leeuwenhoekiella aestuarii]RXG12923.1 glycosyltransferase involved in cell wall biosynthesis [Leeuwenhoekiella aestuarii]
MKKLIFLTGEDLLDVDLPIVKKIHPNFDFTWVVVLKGYGWFEEKDLIKISKENNIKLFVFKQTTKLKNPTTLFFHLKVLNFLRKLNPEYIYDSYLGVPYMHFFTSLFLNKRKFIIAIHDVIQHHKMKNKGIRAFYYNFLMRKYQNIHLFSKSQLEIFHQKKSNINKNVLLAPLALKSFGDPMSSLVEKEQFTFLFFGLIRENKGIDILIEAVNILNKTQKNFRVIIAGKAADSSWDKNKVKINNPLDFEVHIRTLKDHEIGEIMNRSHFLVLPYKDVTQSGVLLTSYNYGLPVIASNLEGFKEYIIDTETGFLFECNSAVSLASSMANALELNKSEYAEMKSNLNHFVKREISIESIAAKYIKYFNDLR